MSGRPLIQNEDEPDQLFIVDDLRRNDKDSGGKGGRQSSTVKKSSIKTSRKRKSRDDVPPADKRNRGLPMENTAPATRSTSTRTASRSTQLGTEVELEMAQAERQDIDIFLEDTAERNNLTVANVKSILKRIVTNEHVVAMCKRSMSGVDQTSDGDNELPFEPKITRAKLRELRAKYPEMEESLMHRYPQTGVGTLDKGDLMKLLKDDIAEDEDNDDEEYQPPSDEELSEDDSETSTSLLNSPVTAGPRSPTLSAVGSPAHSSPCHNVFADHSETIALRTRSKLPLTTEDVEQLEANFIAPDITADMYDTDCDYDDDWNKFLRELMQPRGGIRDEDEEEEDPPYNVLEDNEEVDEFDLRFDRATKISKTELNELVSELWNIPSAVDGAPHANEETEDEDTILNNSRIPTPPLFSDSGPTSTNATTGMMDPGTAFSGLTSNRSCSPIGPTANPSAVQPCRRVSYESTVPLQSTQACLIPASVQPPSNHTAVIIQPSASLTAETSGHQAELQYLTSTVRSSEPNVEVKVPTAIAVGRRNQPSSVTTPDGQLRHTAQTPLRQQDVLSYALSMALNSPSQGQINSPMKIIIQQGSDPPQEICVEVQQQMQEPVGSSVYQNDATSMTMTTVTTGRGESAMNYVSTDQKAIGQTRDLFVDLEKASGQSDSQSATFNVNQQTSKSKSSPQEDFLNENSKSSHIPLVTTGTDNKEFKPTSGGISSVGNTGVVNDEMDEARRLIAASLPDSNPAVQIIYRDNALYQTPIEMPSEDDLLAKNEGVTYEMSDELWDMIRSVEKRFTYHRNISKNPNIIGFSSEMVERLREQVKMYVQLATQLGMLSAAHPHLQVYGDSNQKTLEALAQLSRVQLNPIFEPFNLRPGLQMIEKVRAQLDEHNVHPEFVPLTESVATSENVSLGHQDDRAASRKTAVARRPIPSSLRKMIAWSNVFCFPEILPRVQLVSDLEDYAPTLKSYSKSEDQLIAMGLERFYPDIGHTCPLETAKLIHTYMTPLRRPSQVVDKVRKMMDPDLAPTANPVTHFRVYRSCPPLEWKPRRLMLTPVEQAPYAVPPWVRAFKLSRENKVAVDQLRRSHPPVSLAPSKLTSPTKSSPSLNANSAPSPVKQQPSTSAVNPILKKYKLLPKPNVISVNSGVNKPALSSTPLSKSRKEALLRQMERERDMPEQVISTTNTFAPEGPPEHDQPMPNSNATSPGGGSEVPQSPTSTTMEQQQCAGSSGSTTSNDSEKDSSVLTQTNGSASFAHSVPETPPQSCSQNNTLSAALISGSVDIEPSPDDENATGGRNNCSKYEDSNSKIIAKEKDHSLEGVEDDSGRENAVAAADTGEAEPDPETEADSIQEQLDALMAASSKISRNTVKCPRKHRQLIKDLEATLPLLDTQQLIEDDERENQFILNYVAKAKKFLDHDKVLEMVSVLKKYKDNVKELFVKLDDTLSSCPALVEDLVLFLDAEQAFLAGRFQQHLALAKMRLFLRKTEIHSGSPALAHRLLKALKNCVKSSNASTNPSASSSIGSILSGQTCNTVGGVLMAGGGGGVFSSVTGISSSTASSSPGATGPISEMENEDEHLASQVVAAVTPLLRGQPHLMEEFLALFPNQRVEASRMTDFDEVILLGEDPPPVLSGRAAPNSQGEGPSDADEDIVEVVRLPPSPEPVGGRRCPCKCHQTNTISNSSVNQHYNQHSGFNSSGSTIYHFGANTAIPLGGASQKGPTEEHHKLANRDRHCVECAIRFVDGKVFLQTGKTMKPAAVRFVEEAPEEEEPPLGDSTDEKEKGADENSENRFADTSASLEEEAVEKQFSSKESHEFITTAGAIKAAITEKKFWTRERDGVLLSTWQSAGGDMDTCCTDVASKLGISKDEAQKRLAFLMNVYSSYLTQSRQQQQQLSQS
ncbi:uncharacterized protein LOC111254892 isoform X2 [Varroa destructor]|uniref:GON-4-like protein n=1 Tax=Varroa destructor TaxID=109461 RepID=A0A7M7MF42_VARDE|nr:uncharacterized protein LOC111254892 isoform X2 [Varroa destructor]